MSGRWVAWTALSADRRAELQRRLEERPVMAERTSPRGTAGFVFAALAIGGFAALYFWLGAGIVTGSQHFPVWISLALYGGLGGLAVLGVVRGLAGQRRRSLPFPPGRFLHTWGFVDARDPILLVRSLAELERVELTERPMSIGDIQAITVVLHFKDAVERMDMIARSAPRQELAAVEARAKQLAALGASAPAQATEQDPLAPDKLPAGNAGPPRLASRARAIALAGGLVTALAMWLVVLPFRSLAAVADGGESQRAVARAFPWPWVQARVKARGEVRYQTAAAKLATLGLDPALRTAYQQLLAHARETGDHDVRVSLSVPFGDALKQPDQRLTALAGGLATPAPIQFFTSSGGPGAERFVAALDDALGRFAPDDVLRATSTPARQDRGAELAITLPGLQTVGMMQGQSRRAYAQLAFVFHARLEVPGGPPLDLGDFPVAAQSKVEVGRMTFGDEKLPPLGASGDPGLDAMEDAILYKQELDVAAAAAAQAIAAKLGASGAF